MIEKKDVLITIKGDILDPDTEDQSVELKTEGEAFKENDQEGLTYEETEIYGMEGTTTTILIDPNVVSIIRLGSINSELNFTPDKRNVTLYATPYGEIQIGILTNQIKVNYNDSGWVTDVLVDYLIEIANAQSLHNTISIHVDY